MELSLTLTLDLKLCLSTFDFLLLRLPSLFNINCNTASELENNLPKLFTA